MLIAEYQACSNDDLVKIIANHCLLNDAPMPNVELFQMHSGPALVLGYQFEGGIEEIAFTKLGATIASKIVESKRVIIHDDQGGVSIEVDAVAICPQITSEKLA
ncbi:hypothetical protein VXJ36_22910 [Pseudomonas nitroreducens]|uniref:hypothetical protein n=1 Tax=Pseudomonas nitroreducens TaxID=46680 RepID=UPI002F35A26B